METAEYALMDSMEDRMWWYRALHIRLIAALEGVRGRVLDAGCGTGGLLDKLQAAMPALALIGLEWSPHAASRAAEKSGVPVTRGSINALPFAADSFDAAVAADVLCHAAVDPAVALGELHRVLRPRGRLVVNMPALGWLASAHDVRVHNARRLTAAQTEAMLRKAGFTPIRTHYWNGLLLPLMIIQRKILARGEASSDVAPFPPWLDATLHGITEFERRLPVRPPLGGSVLAVAERT